MNEGKVPDCVRMKWEVQRRITQEYEGMSRHEARAAQRRHIEDDPILGPYLQKVPVLPVPATRSAP